MTEKTLSNFIILGEDLPKTKVVTTEDIADAVRRLKEDLVLIYGINEENSLKSGVSEKLRLEILDLLNGCLTEVEKRVNSIFGSELAGVNHSQQKSKSLNNLSFVITADTLKNELAEMKYSHPDNKKLIDIQSQVENPLYSGSDTSRKGCGKYFINKYKFKIKCGVITQNGKELCPECSKEKGLCKNCFHFYMCKNLVQINKNEICKKFEVGE